MRTSILEEKRTVRSIFELRDRLMAHFHFLPLLSIPTSAFPRLRNEISWRLAGTAADRTQEQQADLEARRLMMR